jgi:extradiol dioxygenase family protein
MKITETAFTGYPVTDMPRARAFYEGVLKLESSRVFGDNARQWVEYDLGMAVVMDPDGNSVVIHKRKSL